MTNRQKFSHGDHVKIADDLGSSMSHFTSGVEAIVVGSYADQFRGSNTKDYTLFIKGKGQSSWYEEHQLTLLESNRADLLKVWEKARDDAVEQQSDLDWIFDNPDKLTGASLQALADCMGIGSLWGPRGEGMDLYRNQLQIQAVAQPYLKDRNKAGWLEFCESYKSGDHDDTL